MVVPDDALGMGLILAFCKLYRTGSTDIALLKIQNRGKLPTLTHANDTITSV